MAANANALSKYGWCTSIRGKPAWSGGAVENLPCHTFPSDDGGVDMKCRPRSPSAINKALKAKLAKNGFMPLVRRKKTPTLLPSFGARSLQKSRPSTRPDATANARLASRLPYLFACCPLLRIT